MNSRPTTAPISKDALRQLRQILPDHPLTGDTSTVRHSQVEFLGSLVDDSGIIERIDSWQALDHPRKGPGGRRRIVDTRTVFILLLILATEHSSLLVERMANLVQERLSNKSLRYLNLWEGNRTRTQWYFCLYRALHRAISAIDPKPGRRKKFPTPVEIENTIREREAGKTYLKQERLDWVCNQLLEATLRIPPQEVQDNWEGDLSADATVVAAYGGRGKPWGDTHLAIEPDAGWYLRDSNHKVPDQRRKAKKAVFGWDLTIAVQANPDPQKLANFPLLVAGIGMTIPGTNLIETGRHIFESVAQRGHKPGRATGDRGYAASAKPEDYQIPLRKLGYDIITDYRDDQLGKKDGYAGSIQVEGAFYCPSMPKGLIEATKDLRAKRIDHKTWRLRIAERRQYMLRPKHKPDASGSVPMMCPARGPGATVTCPLAGANHGIGIGIGKTPVFNPPSHPDRICTNRTSVTFPIEAGAKLSQSMHYGSAAWQEIYSSDRNTIEGTNAYLKDTAHEAIGAAGRRRLRGYTAQYVLITVLVAAGNLRKIDRFAKELLGPETAEDKEVLRTRKLQTRQRRKDRKDRVAPWGDFKPPIPAETP